MTDDRIEHSTLNLALAAIMAEVSYIEKDAENPIHKYRYASEETIKKTLRAALVKHGVLFSLDTYDPQVLRLTTVKDGKENIVSIVTLQCEYEFTLVETGEAKRGKFVGAGSGRDDKGIYAAVTGAIKYALTSRFLIPTGDDPEQDRGVDPKAAPQNAASAPPRHDPAPASPRAQGSSRPASKPAGKHPDPEPQDNDEEAVWDLARALDQHSEDTGQKFRIVKGEKLGLFGKIADRVGVGAGNHAPSDLNPLQLARLRNFYEYLCKQNDISVDLPF